MHHSGHRHSERDLLALHSSACPHERVQSAGAECAERSPQVPLLHVRVHHVHAKYNRVLLEQATEHQFLSFIRKKTEAFRKSFHLCFIYKVL